MGKYNVDLAAIGLIVPTMTVIGPLKTNVTIPITDHPPIIQNTAVGVIASLNIWCPGTRIAPPIASAIGAGNNGFRLESGDYKQKMQAMAAYIYQLFSTGVGLLALQEVPPPGTNAFDLLVSELRTLDARKNLINLLDLSVQWQQTGSESFGTTLLCNPAYFNIAAKVATSVCLDSRGQVHTVIPTSTGVPIQIANIHGDFKKQPETLAFMSIFGPGILVGDSNLSAGKDLSAMQGFVSAEAPLLDIPGSTASQVQVSTLDVVIDRVSPPSFQPTISGIMVAAPTSSFHAFKTASHLEICAKNESIIGIIIRNGCQLLSPGEVRQIGSDKNICFRVGKKTKWPCIIYTKDKVDVEVSIQPDGNVKIRDKNDGFKEISQDLDKVSIINDVLASLGSSGLIEQAQAEYNTSRQASRPGRSCVSQ